MRPHRSLTVLALGLVVATAAAGCGTQVSTAPTTAPATIGPTPTSAPTASPATTPVPPSPTPVPTTDIPAVAAAYLAMAEAYVAAQANANQAIDAAADDAAASDAYQKVVDADAAAIAAIKKISFPGDIQTEVANLIAGYEKAMNVFIQLTADPNDPDPTIDPRLKDAGTAIRAAGTAIRARLGLPPPPSIAPG